MRGALRRQGVRALLTGLVAGIVVLAVGLVRYDLTPAWLVGAGIAAVFVAALGWLAYEPDPTHHPQAGREDRGFNYVRGEGGGSGGA